MKALSVSNSIPQGLRIGYSPLLYNRPSFLSVNNGLPQLHFYLIDKASKVALGHIAFSREESEVVSPFKAPFGGFELAGDLDSTSFLFFVTEVMRMLKENSIRFMRIHLAPMDYLPCLDMAMENLVALGFREKQKLVHHIIKVGEAPFEKLIASMEVRKLKKARTLGCEFRFEKREQYAAIFDFIKQHRESKGHELSMSWDMLRDVLKDHGDHYHFCSVRLEGEMIAAAVMVRVNEKVMYYFIPGHDATFNHLSPMVFLVGELYKWCREHGLQSIDLGTSYWANEENESLARFKEHLGGKPSMSSVFRKALSS